MTRDELLPLAKAAGIPNPGALATPALRNEVRKWQNAQHLRQTGHAGLTGEAHRRAVGGESLEEQSKQARSKIEQEDKQMAAKTKAPKGVQPDSDRQRGRAVILKILKTAKGPLTKEEIHKRATKAGFKPKGKTTDARQLVYDAYWETQHDMSGDIGGGYRVIRPERGKYTVEKIPQDGQGS